MWESTPPPEFDGLRQGDLIRDVPFPALKEMPKLEDGRADVRFTLRPAIIVSQCCSTQQRGVAELAAVVRTGPLLPDHGLVKGLTSPWPAREGARFYDGMMVEPVGELFVEHPNDAGKMRYWHADFRIRVTFLADQAWIVQRRIARMTPVARRNLRMRLGAWYSRVEDSDAIALAELGEFTGLGDTPVSERPGN